MEWKQFGAVLPTYTKEQRIKSTVLYLSDYDNRQRVDEALAGLISISLIEYPVFGGFSCKNYNSYDVVSREWGKTRTLNYIIDQIEVLSPKVIVTHSTDDASAAHRFTAECVQEVRETDRKCTKVIYVGRGAIGRCNACPYGYAAERILREDRGGNGTGSV